MLPSKGYFSGMPCPFYDSSICERPHCHFRHSKKDKTNNTEEEGPKLEKDKNVNIIKELVTETVKHVLSRSEIREKTESTLLNTDAIVTDVVKTFQPSIESKIDAQKKDYSNSSEVPSYKPTPISELNKKHIPVVYAPTRPIYLDRFKKKEIRDSVLYTPKSINENSPPSTTYIPSSSKACCEAYSPESISSYKYYTNQITNDSATVSKEKSNISNIELNYNKEIENQDALEALDRLIDDEFSPKPELDALSKSNANETIKVLNNNVPDKNITDQSHQVIGREANSLKNKTFNNSRSKEHSFDTSSIHSSSQDKHSHSKSKTHPKDNSSISISSGEKHGHSKSNRSNSVTSKSSTSVVKHVHSKAGQSSNDSSKPSSSREKNSSSNVKHSHSNDKTYFNDNSSKHSSSQEKHKHSKSKNHSSESSLKSNVSQERSKKVISKKCVKDKNKSTHNKEKSRSNNSRNPKENRALTKLTSDENLTKKKEECKKIHKKRGTSPYKEKSYKDLSKKVPNETSLFLNSDEFLKSDSLSSTSDLEEIHSLQEPILIDSSSSSSSIFELTADHSQNSLSPKENSDNESEIVMYTQSSPSTSEYACDSPPPAKRLKKDDEDSKVTLTSSFFTSSVFSDRWKKARETVNKKSSAAGKIKIAHVPNVTSLLSAKNKLIAKTKLLAKDDLKSKKPEDIKDPDTGKRIRKAHVPSQERRKYPSPIMEENLKVPFSIRQSCLNNLYDEYLKYCEEEEARVKAQTEEVEICRRLHVPKTYQNAVALSLLKIRKMKGKSDAEFEVSSNKLSSESIPEFTYGWTLYKCFAEYLMKEEEFVSHGFPIEIISKPGCAYIEKTARRYDIKQPDDPNSKICANCSNNYYVDEKGFPLKEFDCFYHWGRLGRTRVRGGITEFYRCCNGEIGSEPCTNGRYHVCSSYDEDCLEGFVQSRSCYEDPEKAGIYAMDCEMCYTTKGLDLTRCTVVDINGKMVYDEVIVPDNPILDYNTRFSGITEDMILKSRKKLRHVQRDLLKFINEKSILVGHSLENDFKALRLLHRTVVDTSIVFPHNLGLPYKRALKLIAKDILKINIQENESGHDSYEDANTCMQIMLAKIKEEAKKRKPRVIISLDSKSKPKLKCP